MKPRAELLRLGAHNLSSCKSKYGTRVNESQDYLGSLPVQKLPDSGPNLQERRGPDGTRTRTIQLDRLMCSHYTTGPGSSLRERNPGHKVIHHKLWQQVPIMKRKVKIYTPSSSCIHSGSGLGSAVKSSISFSRTRRLLGGFERNARSDFATRRMARVSSRLDL